MAFGGESSLKTAKSDINMAPLVDIVLVMLIIFLVAMPIVMKNIEIEVPRKLDEAPETVILPDQTTVELSAGGVLLLDGIEISRGELATKLRDKLQHKREKIVFVDFDRATRYGEAVSVMDTVKGAGATTIALKMQEEGGGPSGQGEEPAPEPE
jgi:biopolymer transport protein TolR